MLGIRRANGHYMGAPGGQTNIEAGDTLLLYGREPLLAELNEREADTGGEIAHQEAIAEQQEVLEEQSKQEEIRKENYYEN